MFPQTGHGPLNIIRLTLLLALLLCPAVFMQAQSWQLTWSDEFNGPAKSLPAKSDWNVVSGPGPQANHEIQWYCPANSNQPPCDPNDLNLHEDGEGHLVIKAIHNGQRWSSARLSTEEKHTILYGRVEARLRMESGAGFWPAFWLLGDDIRTQGWPTCGELDIVEWVNDYGSGTTSSTIHGPGYSGGEGIGKKFAFPNGGRIDDNQFHTYGMTWSKDRIEFYRDDPDKPFQVITPASLPPGKKWVFDHPFYVILNFAIADAGFGGTVDKTTPRSGTMWVDYVRFYQKQH